MPHIHVIGGVSDKDAPTPVVPEPIQVEDILAGAIALSLDVAEPKPAKTRGRATK